MNMTVFLSLILAFLGVLMYDALIIRRKQNEVQKHDAILFPFCQLRRDIIAFLHANVVVNPDSLSRNEYRSLRRLLNALDVTIHNYNRHKTVMFNLRGIMRDIQTYKRASETVVDVTDNAKIRGFHDDFRRLLVKAFVAYTPMIKSELAIKLIVQSARLGYRAGKASRMRMEAEYIAANAQLVRDDARRYGLIPVTQPRFG